MPYTKFESNQPACIDEEDFKNLLKSFYFAAEDV